MVYTSIYSTMHTYVGMKSLSNFKGIESIGISASLKPPTLFRWDAGLTLSDGGATLPCCLSPQHCCGHENNVGPKRLAKWKTNLSQTKSKGIQPCLRRFIRRGFWNLPKLSLCQHCRFGMFTYVPCPNSHEKLIKFGADVTTCHIFNHATLFFFAASRHGAGPAKQNHSSFDAVVWNTNCVVDVVIHLKTTVPYTHCPWPCNDNTPQNQMSHDLPQKSFFVIFHHTKM